MSRRLPRADRRAAAWACGALLTTIVALALALALPGGTVLAAPTAPTETGGMPAAPGAGQLPAASTCDPPSPAGTEYCQLTRMCAEDLTGATAELKKACAALKEREQLRICQAARHTTRPCTAQFLRLEDLCVDPAADQALCTEYWSRPDATADPAGGGIGDATDSCDPDAAAADGQGSDETCPTRGDTDILTENGGASPWCKRTDLDEASKAVCASSRGAISHPHPLSSYGLDWWIGNKLLNPFDTLAQGVVEMGWKLVLWSLSSALLLLDWAFSMELSGKAMPDIEASMLFLHEIVLGPDWMLAAIAMLGLWGLWHGLVKGQTIQTFSGLASAVGMMVIALVIINDPRGTVGEISRWTNQSSVAALSVSSVGVVRNPGQAFGNAQRRLFTSSVVRPWCVMQFGDVHFCDRPWKGPLPGNPFAPAPGADPGAGADAAVQAQRAAADRDTKLCGVPKTVADAWLCYPADSPQRKALYEGLKQQDSAKVNLQESTGAFDRVVLLILVGGGLLGGVASFGYVGGHALLAGTQTIVYLLLAPAMLIAPAAGQRGKDAFIAWFLRLLGSVVSKFAYSIGFGVLVLVTTVIANLRGLGFYPQWLLMSAYWWGVFFKRRDLVNLATLGDRGEANTGLRLAGLYLGYRGARDLAGDAIHVGTSPWRGGVRVRDNLDRRRQAKNEAVSKDADRELDDEARTRVARRHERDQRRAEGYHRAGREHDAAANSFEHAQDRQHAAEDQLEGLRDEQQRLQDEVPGTPPLNASQATDAERYHAAGRQERWAQRRRRDAHRQHGLLSQEHDDLLQDQDALEADGPVPTAAELPAASRYHEAGDELGAVSSQRAAVQRDLGSQRDERERLVEQQERADSAGLPHDGVYATRRVKIGALGSRIAENEAKDEELGQEEQGLEDERSTIAAGFGGNVPTAAAVANAPQHHANAQRLEQLDREIPQHATTRQQMDDRIATLQADRQEILDDFGGVAPDEGWADRAREHGAIEAEAEGVEEDRYQAMDEAQMQSEIMDDRAEQRRELEDELGGEQAARSWTGRVFGRDRNGPTTSDIRDERRRMEDETLSDDMERNSTNAQGGEYVTGRSRWAAKRNIKGDDERKQDFKKDRKAARRKQRSRRRGMRRP